MCFPATAAGTGIVGSRHAASRMKSVRFRRLVHGGLVGTLLRTRDDRRSLSESGDQSQDGRAVALKLGRAHAFDLPEFVQARRANGGKFA